MSIGGRKLHKNFEIITCSLKLCSTPEISVTVDGPQQRVCVSFKKVHTHTNTHTKIKIYHWRAYPLIIFAFSVQTASLSKSKHVAAVSQS